MTTDLDRVRDAYPTLTDDPPATTQARLDALYTDQHPPRRRRRRVLVPVLGAMALAVAIVAVVALTPGDVRTPDIVKPAPASARAACAQPRDSAGDCLRAVSAIAGLHELPGRGDVLYQQGSYVVISVRVDDTPTGGPGNHKQLAAARTPFEVQRVLKTELWIAPDGSARSSHADRGPVRLPSPQDRAAWKAAGSPDLESLVAPGAGEYPLVHDLTADEARSDLLGANGLADRLPQRGDPLAELPREPGALRRELHRMAWEERAAHEDSCALDGEGCSAPVWQDIARTEVGFVATLLRYPATTPTLRAALIAVLGSTPGARSLGLIEHPSGREVAAIQLDGKHDPDGLDVIAFDPVTGALRGQAVRDGGAAVVADGALRWFETIADVGARVQRIGERP